MHIIARGGLAKLVLKDGGFLCVQSGPSDGKLDLGGRSVGPMCCDGD